jgi:hypothetical protein
MSDPEAYEKYCSWCEYIGIVPAEYQTWKKTTGIISDAVKQVPNHFGKENITVLRRVINHRLSSVGHWQLAVVLPKG